MNNNIIPVYQPMKDAVKTTGLSEYYLRKLLKAGKLPHIKNGAKNLRECTSPFGTS